MPDLTKVVDLFGQEWWTWWARLQNKRLSGHPQLSPGAPPPKPEDVQEVMKGGANGVFLLLLSLAWWGLAARDQGGARGSAWKHAYEDFHVVLTFMNDQLVEQTNKRAPSEDLNNQCRKRSRYFYLLKISSVMSNAFIQEGLIGWTSFLHISVPRRPSRYSSPLSSYLTTLLFPNEIL